jgi:putative protease
MELLAPAGTLPAFEAALREGADAVYIGAPGLNARALARDFSFAEIAAMIGYAHDKGKKLYVAMNSLVKEGEVRLALETLALLAKMQPDALIIQDIGLLHLVRRFFPELRVHASTLMTINNSLAADYLKSLGFQRIVLARELSLEEIRTIHRHSAVDLEIFIHGAMCYSYSGLCRFSSLHGGKSSLRGQCVQPCRRRYDWLSSGKRNIVSSSGKGGGYLFSMNDLSGIDHLDAVRTAGVVSLKIEGRLKSVEYVRNAVRAYRLGLDALDTAPEQQKEMLLAAHRCLDEAMGRKRSSGFFITDQQDKLIVPRLSGSTGEVIGKVIRVDEPRGKKGSMPLMLHVKLQAAVHSGDRLRLYDERTGERKSFTLHSLALKGRKIEQGQPGQTVAISLPGLVLGSRSKSFQGILFRVDVSGRGEKQRSSLIKSIAKQQVSAPDSTGLDKMMAALLRPESNAMVRLDTPVSRRGRKQQKGRGESLSPEWWIRVSSLEALSQRYPFKVASVLIDLNKRNLEQHLRYQQRKKARQAPLVWALPPIIMEEQLSWYTQAIEQLRQQGSRRFQVSHFGQIALFRSGCGTAAEAVELYGDYSCNVLNNPALQQWAAQGMAGMQFSLETDRQTLLEALGHFSGSVRAMGAAARMKVGLLLYGRPPLFTARLDAPHFKGHRSFISSRGERFYLDRQEEALYARSHVPFSLLPYSSELAKIGLDYFVVDVSQGPLKSECAEVIASLGGRGTLPAVSSGNYTGSLM